MCFTVLKYFLSFRIFEQVALALKTKFALKFFKTGGAAAPHNPPPRTPMVKAHCWCWVKACQRYVLHTRIFVKQTFRKVESLRKPCVG